jgi:hypothetical protein
MMALLFDLARRLAHLNAHITQSLQVGDEFKQRVSIF